MHDMSTRPPAPIPGDVFRNAAAAVGDRGVPRAG